MSRLTPHSLNRRIFWVAEAFAPRLDTCRWRSYGVAVQCFDRLLHSFSRPEFCIPSPQAVSRCSVNFYHAVPGGVGVGVGDAAVDGEEEDDGRAESKLPILHSITSTIAATITTRLSEIDHPMHTILDRFFLFRSSHVSLEGENNVSTIW